MGFLTKEMKIYIIVYSYYIFLCSGLFYLTKAGGIERSYNRGFIGKRSTKTGERNLITAFLDRVNLFSYKIGRLVEKISIFKSFSKYSDVFTFLVEEKILKISFHSFLGYKVILSVLFAIAGGCVTDGFLVSVLLFMVFGVVGYFTPDLLLRRFNSKRLEKIDNHLPYVVDLLYVATLAGQNIYNAIGIVVEKYEEGISFELRRFLKDIDLGVGKMEAYHNILRRNNPENLKSLVFLLMQAEKYGSSISEVLKQKSEHIRFESFQDSERKARKISLTMLFPLVFLILPSFVLLVGGPLVYSLGGNFLSF